MYNFDYNFYIDYLINFSLYNFLYNNLFVSFTVYKSEIPNIFLGLEYSLLIYLFHLFLLLLGRLIYTKLGLKRKNYGNIYILAFVLRIFPIVGIISSFLLGTNSEKLGKVIKIFTIGFILYTIISYLIFKFFNLTWLNIFGLFL